MTSNTPRLIGGVLPQFVALEPVGGQPAIDR
jgi:hypothetical protein